MPNYEVEHISYLSEEQRDQIAEAITRIHTEQFRAPRLFVNVRFTNIQDHAVYVAGKRRTSNRIFASVRHGPSRTQHDYQKVSYEIVKAWNDIVINSELRMVMFFGSITAVYEAGFMMPQAGGDKEWLEENMEAFEQKAQDGDEEFADMIEEVRDRGLV